MGPGTVEFLIASENTAFAVALAVMLGIAVMEGALTLIGAGLSNVIDAMLPDVDVDIDFEAEIDIGKGGELAASSQSGLSRLLGWLMVGRVPALVLLVVFLTVFGLSGYIMQAFVQGMTGFLIPGSIAWVPALVVTFPVVRVTGKGLAKLIPKDNTTAVSSNSFVGRMATIVTGTAAKNQPAEARLKDSFGQSHYVLVEPDVDSETFRTGAKVLLVSKNGMVKSATNREHTKKIKKRCSGVKS